MTGISLFSTVFLFLCPMIALFYLFRLVCGRRWLGHVDAENEIGHGMMAIGMMFMLAPAGSFPSVLLQWNILLFAAAALWWTSRLFLRKPLLALLFRSGASARSTVQSDGIHVFMHGGMCYMFLLMSSMAFSMLQPAIYANGLFFASFAALTFFYVREITKDLQTAKRNWLQFGANLAHTFMSGMMCWMFLGMITMTINMNR